MTTLCFLSIRTIDKRGLQQTKVIPRVKSQLRHEVLTDAGKTMHTYDLQTPL